MRRLVIEPFLQGFDLGRVFLSEVTRKIKS